MLKTPGGVLDNTLQFALDAKTSPPKLLYVVASIVSGIGREMVLLDSKLKPVYTIKNLNLGVALAVNQTIIPRYDIASRGGSGSGSGSGGDGGAALGFVRMAFGLKCDGEFKGKSYNGGIKWGGAFVVQRGSTQIMSMKTSDLTAAAQALEVDHGFVKMLIDYTSDATEDDKAYGFMVSIAYISP